MKIFRLDPKTDTISLSSTSIISDKDLISGVKYDVFEPRSPGSIYGDEHGMMQFIKHYPDGRKGFVRDKYHTYVGKNAIIHNIAPTKQRTRKAPSSSSSASASSSSSSSNTKVKRKK